jgi:hypothetical protein
MPIITSAPFINPEELEGAFSFADGFHRADWDVVRRWLEDRISPIDNGAAWNEAALLWIRKLRDDLGGGYFVLESNQTILLCDQPREKAEWLLDYVGRAEDTIKDSLGSIAWEGASGKGIVLVFSDTDDYYQYLSYHLPEGEQPASGGVCIHSGYTHVAVPWHDPLDAANAVIHELTHDCLAHLPLPHWLNEGVAMTLQRLIAPPSRGLGQSEQDAIYAAAIGWRPPLMWHELAERHLAFWTEQNIQSFWAGTSFFEPGDPNELSYSLAEVFVKLLSERGDATAFRAFIERARQDDAGQTAGFDIFGIDLDEIASTFLGEGNWRPQRKAMIACWNAAGWKKEGSEEQPGT